MLRTVLALELAAVAVAVRAFVLPFAALLRRVDRYLIWRLKEVCFGSRRPGVYPEVPLSSVVGSATRALVIGLPAETYNVSELELLAIAAIAAHLRPSAAFEFGTADGRTTRTLAANLPTSGRCYTINLPLGQDPGHRQEVPVGARFRDTDEAARIVQLWGDTATFDFWPHQGKCQLVFIDADHSEAAVRRDSETALRLVDRSRGVILWHDALRFGVQRALPRLSQEQGLPIYLITDTNLAMLAFRGGMPVAPATLADQQSAR
jgi:predicted O-methyltransferase YrrM